MSCRSIDALEFECDGQCGTSSTVTQPRNTPSYAPVELPKGWATIKLTQEAAVVWHRKDTTMHVCPRCLSMMMLTMWNDERKVALLSAVGEDELEDLDLDPILARARASERARKAALEKQKGTPT